MGNNKAGLLHQVAEYYSAKLDQHGMTPGGVDWNSEESQLLRFRQLIRVIDDAEQFSINDLGCGYGALLDFLEREFSKQFSYLGIDVSASMIDAAKIRHAGNLKSRFIVGSRPDQTSDYGIASGIFNVRLEKTDSEWFAYVENTLDLLNESSRKGFAFNCLTSYSDPHRMRDDLYYADPCQLFDLCKRKYAKNIALLHDYGLYEFTILVKKQ